MKENDGEHKEGKKASCTASKVSKGDDAAKHTKMDEALKVKEVVNK